MLFRVGIGDRCSFDGAVLQLGVLLADFSIRYSSTIHSMRSTESKEAVLFFISECPSNGSSLRPSKELAQIMKILASLAFAANRTLIRSDAAHLQTHFPAKVGSSSTRSD